MTILHKNLKAVALSLLLGVSSIASAEDGELCAPFKNDVVDQDLLAQTLQAADGGDLYRIKRDTSTMGLCVDSPIGLVKAEFEIFKGGFGLRDFIEKGTTLVHLDVESLNTESFVVETMLKGESFLDSEQFPDIFFIGNSIEWTTDDKAILKGDLTIRGITKEVAFYVDLHRSKDDKGEAKITIKATTTIQRSEFDMYTLSPVIDDRVTLCMQIETYKHINI